MGIFVALGLMAAQLKTGGRVLALLFDLHCHHCILLFMAVLVVYTAFGGMKSVMSTDLVQMVACGIIIPMLALVIYRSLPNQVNPLANSLSQKPLSDIEWIVWLPMLVYLMKPTLRPLFFQRIAASKDIDQAKSVLFNSFWIMCTITIHSTNILIFPFFCYLDTEFMSRTNP